MRYRPIRVDEATYDLVREVVSRVARDGWRVVGQDRADAATIKSVVSAAIFRLATELEVKVAPKASRAARAKSARR